VAYTWRFKFEAAPPGVPPILEFDMRGRWLRGRQSDDPTLPFGWRLWEAATGLKPGE
jgi:hypothetical protein